MVLTRKYYKKKLWKVTTYLRPLGEKPHNGQGFKFIKTYEKKVDGEFKLANYAEYELGVFARRS